MRISFLISGRLAGLEPQHSLALDMQSGATVDDALEAVRQTLSNGQKLAPTALVAVSGNYVGTVAQHWCQRLEDADELFIFAPVGGG